MAIAANRYWLLLMLLAGAVTSYAVGFMVGVWLFVAVGGVIELFFWREILKRARRR